MLRKVGLVLASIGIVEAFTIVPLRSDGVRFAESSLSVRRCSIPVLATPLSGLNSYETPKTVTETPFIDLYHMHKRFNEDRSVYYNHIF
jgi:hypothetical protein